MEIIKIVILFFLCFYGLKFLWAWAYYCGCYDVLVHQGKEPEDACNYIREMVLSLTKDK